MPRGRIPFKQKRSIYEIKRAELKEALGAFDKKEEPKPFNNKAFENVKSMYGKVVEEKIEKDVDKMLIEDMSVAVKDYVIGSNDVLDTELGVNLFCKKGVVMFGADMINSKRLMYLSVLHGIESGVSLEELSWAAYYPGRQLPSIIDVATKMFGNLINEGWISSDDLDRIKKGDIDKDILLYLTEKGKENTKALVGILNDEEKDALRIGAGKRVAFILKERKAGRGYVPVPKVDNTKPAYDRKKDVFALAKYLFNMDEDSKDVKVLKEE